MMKKVLALLLALTMVLSLALAGCTKEPVSNDEETPPVQNGEDVNQEEEDDDEEDIPAISLGLVTDVGGIDDKSFNQGTWEGVERFADKTGSSTKYLQSENDADYVPNLSAFSDEELDLIVAPGFLFEDSLKEVSANFPDQKYLIIDTVVDAPNVASAVFAEEQGSFLVGVAAALKTKEAGKNIVGYIGGMDFDIIQKFEAGFEAGVKAVDPDIQVLVEYVGSFADAQKAQTQAAKMYDQGAYVIYHAAGASGNGMIKEAKDRVTNGQEVWAIGVDKDQYEDGIYEGDKSVILTSMMKRVDVAAYEVAKQVALGQFAGGEVLVFTLDNGGVGIPDKNPNLSDDIISQIGEFEAKVKAGELEVPAVPSRVQ